jgi:hypothetical protein
MFLFHIHIYNTTGVTGHGLISQTKLNSTKNTSDLLLLDYVIFSAHPQVQSTLNFQLNEPIRGCPIHVELYLNDK